MGVLTAWSLGAADVALEFLRHRIANDVGRGGDIDGISVVLTKGGNHLPYPVT